MTRRNRKRLPAPPKRQRRFRMPGVDLRRPLRIAAGIAVIAAIAAAFGALIERPVRQIVVDAPFQRVTEMQIEAAAAPLVADGFLSMDLDAIAAAVSSIDWVDRVRVRRQWPAAVRVIVTEQVAAARWGETGLLNTRGELFMRDARHIPPELPRLAGPPGTEWEVAQRYQQARRALLPMGLSPVSMTLNRRGSWQMELAGDVTVRLGRDAVDERMARFLDVVAPMMLARPAQANYIDMRYTNGFAVSWRPPTGTAVGSARAPQGEDSDA